MVAGDPALIVVLVGTSGNGSGFATRGGLGGNIGIRSLLSLALDGPGSLGLGKQSLDPGLVDEVAGSAKDAGEEDVQEDAVVSAR